MNTRLRVAALLLAAVAGCSESMTREDVVVRDSAGIAIIENVDGGWTAEDAWRIETEPSVRIGVTDGAPEYQLYRVQSALRLDDGTIVIANSGSGEIRFYDANGTHIRSVGRAGEGPGEFGFLNRVARRGRDSLVAWDPPLRRASVFGLDGSFGRTVAGPAFAAEFYFFRDTFDDGSFLGHIDEGVQPAELAEGWHPAMSLWFRFYLDGRVDTLATIQSGEFYISKRSDSPTLIGPPFDRRTVVVAAGDAFVAGTAHSWELRRYDARGGLARIIRLARANRPLTPAAADSAVSGILARQRSPDRRRMMEELYDGLPFHETMPAYSAIEPDTEGNLWVADYRAGPDDPFRWTVFDIEGRLLGSLDMPAGLTVHEIGADYVLGVTRNEMDVEQVVLHRLIKPAG